MAAIELLKAHFQVPHPILVTSHTNVAVDNLTAACLDAGLSVRKSATGDVADPESTGERLAKEMLEDGADELMNGPP